MAPRMGNEKGMALLLVLVIIVLLTAVITEFAFSSLVELRLAETFRDNAKAYYLAKGGLEAARMLLRNDDNGFDAFSETWGEAWQDQPLGDGVVSLSIKDHDGRFNVNSLVTAQGKPDQALRERLLRLLDRLGIEDGESLVDALTDWIDPDDDSSPFGAESAFYRAKELPPCRNAPLKFPEELLMVHGFTPEIFKKIEPYLTIYGGAKINANTAPVAVLASLSERMDLEAAQKIADYRQEHPFEKVTDLQNVPYLDNTSYLSISSALDVKSTVFQIEVRSTVNRSRAILEAAVEKASDRVLFVKVK